MRKHDFKRGDIIKNLPPWKFFIGVVVEETWDCYPEEKQVVIVCSFLGRKFPVYSKYIRRVNAPRVEWSISNIIDAFKAISERR